MDASDESIIELPNDIVENSAGIAFDIGATLVKLVYRSKQDYKDGSPIFMQDDMTVGRLRSALFLRTNLAEFFDFVKQNCDYTTPDGAARLVTATGCGTSQFRQQLEQELHIQITLLPEWDVICEAFRYFLTQVPSRKALLEPNKEGLADAEKITKQFTQVMEKMLSMTSLNLPPSKEAVDSCEPASDMSPASVVANETGDENKPAETLETPVMLMLAGSSANFLKISQSKSADILSFSSRSGSTFVGLGCLLLREQKSFTELVNLAAKGDEQRVDTCGRDLKAETDQGDLYSAQADDIVICSFGQAANTPAGSFQSEDMLASLLKMICSELAEMAFTHAHKSNIRKVYFAGNFVNNAYVQRIMTSSFMNMENMHLIINREKPTEIAFVRHGGFLGAIGCMLTSHGRQ